MFKYVSMSGERLEQMGKYFYIFEYIFRGISRTLNSNLIDWVEWMLLPWAFRIFVAI